MDKGLDVEVMDNNIEVLVEDPNEIILSTGKRVTKRERLGQHHIFESRLLSACAESLKKDGMNIGDFILAAEIKIAVGIGEVDGKPVKIPKNLAEVYELASKFTYEEWGELKLKMQDNRKDIEAEAKKLQAAMDLEIE